MERTLKEYPFLIEAYKEYWVILKKHRKHTLMDRVSLDILRACENTSIPTSLWTEGHVIRAKTLLLLDRFEEAIKVLKVLCHVLPPLPLPTLTYLEQKIS